MNKKSIFNSLQLLSGISLLMTFIFYGFLGNHSDLMGINVIDLMGFCVIFSFIAALICVFINKKALFAWMVLIISGLILLAVVIFLYNFELKF